MGGKKEKKEEKERKRREEKNRGKRVKVGPLVPDEWKTKTEMRPQYLTIKNPFILPRELLFNP